MPQRRLIFLAAGQGERLRPLTENKPKCLVPLAGRPLLNHNIETSKACGFSDDELLVVTGYRAEQIDLPGIDCVHNSDYESSNMLESLFCAEDFFSDELYVFYSDIYYQKNVLERLMAAADDVSVVLDLQWLGYWQRRTEDVLSDAESLRIEDGCIVDIGQKVQDIGQIEAQYIGLMKFQKQGIAALKKLTKV